MRIVDPMMRSHINRLSSDLILIQHKSVSSFVEGMASAMAMICWMILTNGRDRCNLWSNNGLNFWIIKPLITFIITDSVASDRGNKKCWISCTYCPCCLIWKSDLSKLALGTIQYIGGKFANPSTPRRSHASFNPAKLSEWFLDIVNWNIPSVEMAPKLAWFRLGGYSKSLVHSNQPAWYSM